MKPINAAIFLTGLPCDKQQPIENFPFTDLKQVKERLKELQKGYCEGNEKPLIRPREFNRPGKEPVKALEAYTPGVDFSYVAYLAMKIKEENLPK